MDNFKVLYVDDEFVNRELFKISLETHYHVLLAESGMSGLKILKENSDIQVIISDMKMPHMNGIEFVKKAKELYPTIKCFILTGYGLTDIIQEAINDGLILACLNKPFEMEKINEEIQNVIQ
jgi:response regulator RpfG family c-di-GMP phosphodiesterase